MLIYWREEIIKQFIFLKDIYLSFLAGFHILPNGLHFQVLQLYLTTFSGMLILLDWLSKDYEKRRNTMDSDILFPEQPKCCTKSIFNVEILDPNLCQSLIGHIFFLYDQMSNRFFASECSKTNVPAAGMVMNLLNRISIR